MDSALFQTLSQSLTLFADASAAVQVMQNYVSPTIRTLAALASIACVFFIVNAGYLYMTSTGKPDKLEHAKHVLKMAIIGLVIVIGAATFTSILSSAYGTPQATGSAPLPTLESIKPDDAGNGLIDILIKAVTGFLNVIIQAIAAPFLAALNFFTEATPLMAKNPSVFNLWLAMVGIADVLFVVVLALLGLHVMSASTFGFDELDLKQLLPKAGLAFLLINTSIFVIDALIELSNVLIKAMAAVTGNTSVWDTLTKVVEDTGGQGVAALLIMLAFLIFSVILLVYYVGRLVTLFIGAVLSPLVFLVWLVPGFRDFSETAAKTYISTIFVLFVHVVILSLAGSLFTGIATEDEVPNVLMSMVVGLATVIALLKTQGVMMQFSYVSGGARNARMLGGQFINGMSYMAGKGKTVATKTATATKTKAVNLQRQRTSNRLEQKAIRTGQPQSHTTTNKDGVKVTRVYNPKSNKPKTGTTYAAPKVTPRDTKTPIKTSTPGAPFPAKIPKNNAKDKVT
ncbi:MAG: pilin [Candidatus Saccharimonadales bacterium]